MWRALVFVAVSLPYPLVIRLHEGHETSLGLGVLIEPRQVLATLVYAWERQPDLGLHNNEQLPWNVHLDICNPTVAMPLKMHFRRKQGRASHALDPDIFQHAP